MANLAKLKELPESIHTRAVKGGLVGGVNFVVNLSLNVIQVPLLLRFWPQETYGLWLSVGALAGLLTSLDLGHQAYVGNLLSRYYVEDRILFRRVFASAVRIAAVTSTVQIVLTVLLCASGLASSWLGIDSQHAVEFALAVAIYTVGWISLGSLGSILVRLFLPTGHFVRSTWWGIAARVVQFGAVVVAACLGLGLVGTTLLFVGAVFGLNLLLFADIRRLYPDLFPWWRDGNFLYGFGNFARSSVLTGVSLLDLFSLQGVVLLVAGTLGAAVVPLFTTLRTLANTAMQGTGFLLNPIQSDLVRYHVQRDGAKIGAVFGFFWLTTGALINGGLTLGLIFVEPVYAYWTRGKLAFDRTLFAWLAAAVLVRTLAAPLQYYLSSINELKALTLTSVVRAGLTVGGVLGLSHTWGLAGAGAALFAAELIGSLILPWWYTYRLIAGLGTKLAWSAPGMALLSATIAGVALIGYARQVVGWHWMMGCTLILLLLVVMAQWRWLAPEVKSRAWAFFPQGFPWRTKIPSV